MDDRYDDEEMSVSLTKHQTGETFFLANLFAASCARIKKEPPDSPYAAVIEFCKLLLAASAQNDPAWHTEITERAAVWNDRAKARLN